MNANEIGTAGRWKAAPFFMCCPNRALVLQQPPLDLHLLTCKAHLHYAEPLWCLKGSKPTWLCLSSSAGRCHALRKHRAMQGVAALWHQLVWGKWPQY